MEIEVLIGIDSENDSEEYIRKYFSDSVPKSPLDSESELESESVWASPKTLGFRLVMGKVGKNPESTQIRLR